MKAGGLMLSVLSVLFLPVFGEESVESYQDNLSDNTTACRWIHKRTCPDPEIRFYLYTRSNIDEEQLIHIDTSLESSNLSTSFFNHEKPSKIIIHGFRADMFLTPLYKMRSEYLQREEYNIFYVDWYNLSSSLCYPAVVHNIKHVGECCAQLVNRIRDAGGENIHVIGFSLGAQVANYIANSLKPDYLLPRITGLDPALPLFVTSDKAHKLDSTDAKFVDVFHCNGFMQGQIERCGTVDFYMNGGIYQPGCGSAFLACSHHRCADYFMESIRSDKGFYGWNCRSYFHYTLGLCPFSTDNMLLAGEDCSDTACGMYFVRTNSEFPFAMGLPSEKARGKQWYDDELKIQLEALGVLRRNIEDGKFTEDNDEDDKEGFTKFMKKVEGSNYRDPKVIFLNET